MAWQDIDELRHTATGMQTVPAPNNAQPIIVKYKGLDACPKDHQLFGFTTYLYRIESGVRGARTEVGKICEDRPLTFRLDEMGIGYAVMPDCKRNRDTLLREGMAAALPFTIVEGPRDLVDAFNESIRKNPAKPEKPLFCAGFEIKPKPLEQSEQITHDHKSNNSAAKEVKPGK